MIYGIGTDIIEIARLQKVMARHPKTFLERTFTEEERAMASDMKHAEIYYAGRWAAKEAIAKAFGTGFGKNCNWQDLSISNDDAGKPVVYLNGAAIAFANREGIGPIHLSISHEHTYAVAMAIAERLDS